MESREIALIATLARHFEGGRGAATRLGIGDDAAIVAGEGEAAITCDSFVEGVHFRRHWAPWEITGYKAAVITISDLAAMAVHPEWMLIALGLADEGAGNDPSSVVDGIGAGVARAAREYGFAVVGGDVSMSGSMFISLTAGGRTKKPAIPRSGASEGDLAVVTGPVGRSAAALLVLEENVGAERVDAEAVIAHFLKPAAAFADADAFRALSARALIDISDGLASEASHVAIASGVGVILEASAIPIDSPTRRILEGAGRDPVSTALVSGQEYALLAAVPAAHRESLERVCEARGWSIVGRFTGKPGQIVLEHDGGSREPIPQDALGWRHFSDG